MVRQAETLLQYPPEGVGAPKHRQGHAASASLGLPQGTRVFSADNHISLSEDIFYDRAPKALKDRVPRVIYRDDAWNLSAGDRQFLPKEFTGVLTQYDPLPGSSTGDLEARMAQLEADGVTRELAFPNALMALLYYPDAEVRELCFRVYNEYLADLQEQAPGRFYGVGLINWWDADGARRTLAELKAFGVRTFVLPLKPGNGADGKPLDYNGPAMTGVWEAIEESGLPVAHHIGEAPLSAPCATNMYAVGMIHNAASFREMFGRYVLTGLLDRHRTLRIGWFEGGINWVPAAIQDSEHMYASFQHMLDKALDHDVRYYWDTHMYSAFMYDPLGLDLVDRIGIDRVMWSSDFPHNESTFGYSEKSLAAVVSAVGPEQATRVVSANIIEFLGLGVLTATITVTDSPDLGRMQRDRWVRLHKVMGEQGVGALVLLGNSNVSYATGASWPLADPGRANLDRPVAVVSSEDDHPHLFTSSPELAKIELGLPADHVHGPVYLEFDEGAEAFGRMLCELAPSDGRLAVDDLPGSMRRASELFFPGVEPASGDDVIGTAKLIKSPDELCLLRQALHITEQAIAPVHAALAPGERQTELTARFLRAAFELGAEANILDPIWQVMPARLAEGPWTTHGDIACPLLTTERELHKGDVLWVDTGISYGGFASDFGRTWIVGAGPTARQLDQFRRWQEIIEAVLSVTRAGVSGAELTRAAMAASGGGRRPWMEHFYLGHGLGIDSAEAPFIGTDLGDAYDERQVLAAGMVLVLEPLVWDDGASGYRAEEVVAITDDGYISLTDYPYDPYGD